MADKLAIYKQALVHLEKETIASLTADAEARYVFDNAWDGVVAEAFNEGDWNFAKVSAALDLSASETPALGWSYVFDYPEDYERTIAVCNVPDFTQRFYEYVDQGGYLHANTNVLYLRYISKDKQEDSEIATWPTMFWRYVAMKLAYETCGKLTSGSTLKDELKERLKKALRQLKSVDGRNEPNKAVPTGSWLRSRRGGSPNDGLGNTVIGGEITLGEGDV